MVLPRRSRLLLIVDQFEELLTQADKAARDKFANFIQLLRNHSVELVVGLRHEYLEPLQSLSELRGMTSSKRIEKLQPLGREKLSAVIEKPARLAGIELQNGLSDQLVADTGNGNTLPLLAYTLAKLACGARRGDRLTLQHYMALGGVHGVLSNLADVALDQAARASGRTRDALVRRLLRFVALNEKGRPRTRPVLLDNLPQPIMLELEPIP